MTNAEAILRLKDHFAIHDDGRPTPYLDEAERMALEALEKQMPRADAEELDCKNCIWNDYPVYFKNKCVPCELLKCDCFSKVMYEEWSDMNE